MEYVYGQFWGEAKLGSLAVNWQYSDRIDCDSEVWQVIALTTFPGPFSTRVHAGWAGQGASLNPPLSETDISIVPSPLFSPSQTRRDSPMRIRTLINATSVLAMCTGSTAAAAVCSWWKKWSDWWDRHREENRGLPPPFLMRQPIKQGQW